MPNFTPTDEQDHAARLYAIGDNLRIEALAGTGKTSTLGHLIRQRSPRGGRLLYSAFGNRTIADAKVRFAGDNVTVRTNHSLAWGIGQGYKNAGRLEGRVTATDLIQRFRWTDYDFSPHADVRAGAYAVLETLAAFCQSADPAIRDSHALSSALMQVRLNPDAAHRYAHLLAEVSRQVWAAMIDPKDTLKVTHDVYLKVWALRRPHLPYSTILLDEAQDANGVIIGVLREQPHAQIVVVGDRRQAIFGWRGAQDALDAFDITNACALTRSFRFGPEIAELANAVLRHQCDSDVFLSGDPAQPGEVGECATPRTYLSRKNATLVAQLMELQCTAPRRRVGVVGGVDDLIKLIQGAQRLQLNEPTNVPDLVEFVSWYQVREAVEHQAYGHLRVLVSLVESYGPPALLSALERIRGNEQNEDSCDALLSTAHKSKGREWSSCRLLDDFAVPGPPEDVGALGWTPEDGNLLYVACTRARRHLDVAGCGAVLDSWGDKPFPGERARTSGGEIRPAPVPTPTMRPLPTPAGGR